MNRQEFMKRLEELLTDISQEEREEAIAFYTGYFEDAGVENEEKVIQELESRRSLQHPLRQDLRVTKEFIRKAGISRRSRIMHCRHRGCIQSMNISLETQKPEKTVRRREIPDLRSC